MHKHIDQEQAAELASIHTKDETQNEAINLVTLQQLYDNTIPSIPTKDGYRLNPDHYQEWLSSCVDGELIQVNEIRSVEGDDVYDYLLGLYDAKRRNDGRLTNSEMRRYDHCREGGWWFGSVSVRDGQTNLYGCFKPDNPRENPENGKPIKYEAPKGSKPQLLAFEISPKIWQKISDRYGVPIGIYTNFYIWLFDHPQIPILITEGAKKVGCLLSMGYAAIGVSGVTHCYRTEDDIRKLHSDIEYLCNGSRTIYFAFDSDSNNKTRKTVHSIIRKTAGLIKEYNANCKVYKVTWTGAKGVDDWVDLNGADKFPTLLKRAKYVSPIASDYDTQQSKRAKRRSYNQELFNEIKEIDMDSLRFNEMKMRVEKDGKPLDLDQYYLDLAEYHAIDISKDKAADFAIRIAKENSYHPVREYLNQVAKDTTPIDIDNLSTRYFGTKDPIYDLMVKLKLIGSVARVFDPGCKQDEALVLHGKTGIYKSTWFKRLYGEEFFTDSDLGLDRDGKMALRRYWCVEWQELDAVTSKKEAGQIKSFLSTAIDVYRTPYARCDQDVPRTSVMVASVNTDDFLRDETGNRRYWIIPVNLPPGTKIDIAQIEKERDAIWSAAVQAYFAGHRWHMKSHEEIQSEVLNKDFLERDEWESVIESFISHQQPVTVKKILTNALEIPVGLIQRREQNRVTRILRKLGWECSKNKENYEGTRQRVWKPIMTTVTTTEDCPQSYGQNHGQAPQSSHHQGLTESDHNLQKIGGQVTVTPQPSQEKALQDNDHNISKKTSNFKEGDDHYQQPETNELKPTEEKSSPPNNQIVQENHTVNSDQHPDQFNEESYGHYGQANPEPSNNAGSDVTTTVTTTMTTTTTSDEIIEIDEPLEWDELIQEIDQEMSRLGWSKDRGRGYLLGKYGVDSRQLLSDDEIIEFWYYLKGEDN